MIICGYASELACVLLCNSLPELGDGGGEVGGVGSQPKGFVLAVGVLDAAIGVPGLIAFGPGKLRLKTLTHEKARVTFEYNLALEHAHFGLAGVH